MNNKLSFQNSLGHSYTFALIVTKNTLVVTQLSIYVPHNMSPTYVQRLPPTYKDCEVYSLPSQGEADGTGFECYVTAIITARGRLDQRCCMKSLVWAFTFWDSILWALINTVFYVVSCKCHSISLQCTTSNIPSSHSLQSGVSQWRDPGWRNLHVFLCRWLQWG